MLNALVQTPYRQLSGMGTLIPTPYRQLSGLGCDASTMVGTDCDSFWYYTWPPCWSNSRDTWTQVCQGINLAQGQPTSCTLGLRDSAGGCMLPDWLLPATVLIVAASVVLPSVSKLIPGGRRR